MFIIFCNFTTFEPGSATTFKPQAKLNFISSTRNFTHVYDVNTARVLKHVCPFFNIIHGRVNSYAAGTSTSKSELLLRFSPLILVKIQMDFICSHSRVSGQIFLKKTYYHLRSKNNIDMNLEPW